MKKTYIAPTTKWLNLNANELMIGLNNSVGNKT